MICIKNTNIVRGEKCLLMKKPSILTICNFIIILVNVDIYRLSALRSEKGSVNMLRTLFLIEKDETNIDDIGGKRRYCWNILQWSKNDFKSMIYTNGDY